MDEIGLEKARNRLGEIVDTARIGHRRTLITRQGKPAAWVIGTDDLEDLQAFKPALMSQLCRDGLHCGTGEWQCSNCECLCHLTADSPSVKQAWAERDEMDKLRIMDSKENAR